MNPNDKDTLPPIAVQLAAYARYVAYLEHASGQKIKTTYEIVSGQVLFYILETAPESQRLPRRINRQ